MTPAPAGVEPGWLGLRGPADARARTRFGAGLADALAQHLAHPHPSSGDGGVRLVDVGAGTGAGATWLRPRLPVDQDWRLVDQDPRILAAARPTAQGWARGIVAGVADLPRMLADEPAHVVTCQALLDVLTTEQVDTLLAPAVASGAAVLLALSVTGEVVLSPPHPDDGAVAEAFDAHQRRAGRLGPDGGAYAGHALRRSGYTVTMAATPWHLGADDSALIRAYLGGRAEAAREQDPALSHRVGRWLESRDAVLRRGGLSAVVGHIDVLGLPTVAETPA